MSVATKTNTPPTGQQRGSQMRITPEEKSLIQNTFKGRDELLRLMRKIFLPEIDPTAPIGQIIDLWMTVDIKGQTPEEAYVNLLARNQLIAHIDQQLLTLKLLSEQDAETEAEEKARLAKDSMK